MTNSPRRSEPRPLSDEDEAEIKRQIAADPDDEDVTDAQLARARTFAEALPELADSIRRGSKGRRP